jgi:hypothetical protein
MRGSFIDNDTSRKRISAIMNVTAALQRVGGEGGKSLSEEEALEQTRMLVRAVDATGVTDPNQWQSYLTKEL